jgi:hypothetical protein
MKLRSFPNEMQPPRVWTTRHDQTPSEPRYLSWPSSRIPLQNARNNRGAGRIFRAGDRLIRPSRQLRSRLRYSFTLNEVTKLSTTEGAERRLAEFPPQALMGLRAVHS